MNIWKGIMGVLLVALPLAAMAESGITNTTWKSSLAMGATYKDGNTEKSLFTLHLKGNRYSPKHDWLNNLYAEYGKTQGDQTEGQVRGQTDYRHKFGQGKFFGGVFGEVYYDDLKKIRTRLKIGPNVGYYFVENETMIFDISTGVNWVYERTTTREHNFAEVRAAANYMWDFTETASYYLSIEYSSNVEDFNDGNGLLVTGIKTKMSDQMALFAELRDEYDNTPDGLGVEYNDVTILAGLAYDF